MKKFEVNIGLIERYVFPEVEANTEAEAIEKAIEMLNIDENKYIYHNNSDTEEEAFELDD